jgi:hypothetical protein
MWSKNKRIEPRCEKRKGVLRREGKQGLRIVCSSEKIGIETRKHMLGLDLLCDRRGD